MDEIKKIEEEQFEEAEVMCGQCTGQMKLVRLPPPEIRLFTLICFQRLILSCNLCNRTGKQFLDRIKKEEYEPLETKI